MKQHLGETRSSYKRNHAFIAPDSHELTTLPNWSDTELAVVIAPQLGARFQQYFAHMKAGALGGAPLSMNQRFFMVLAGSVRLSAEGQTFDLGPEGYAIIPVGVYHTITATSPSRLVVLEKPYIALDGYEYPTLHVSKIADHEQLIMKGDERLLLQKLAPNTPSYDFEINVMEFKPGTGLPYVETHYMEHGLLLLDGGGIYRLEDDWYPAEKGDTIWMGPYCPQWFGAIGRDNARYMIYKNWNRDPHAF